MARCVGAAAEASRWRAYISNGSNRSVELFFFFCRRCYKKGLPCAAAFRTSWTSVSPLATDRVVGSGAAAARTLFNSNLSAHLVLYLSVQM